MKTEEQIEKLRAKALKKLEDGAELTCDDCQAAPSCMYLYHKDNVDGFCKALDK